MTDNEILARWQGKCYHVSDWGQTDCKYCGRTNDPRYFDFDSINPDYPNDPAACMSLLDTAANKGYKVQLVSNLQCEFVTWDCFITYAPKQTTQGNMDVQTINEAIVAACLEVARKEQGNE